MSWDVAVAGGGLAGAAAAARLAMAGRRVVLFEREREPHHKVCGEFVSGEAADDLAALDIALPQLGAEPITAVRIVAGHVAACAGLPFPAWGLSRARLDERLLAEAARRGADVRRGLAVRTLGPEGGGARLAWADGSVTAAAAFLATGKHDLRGWRRPSNAGPIGLKLHLRLDPPHRQAVAGHVELVLFSGGYAGLQPVEDGIANLCLLVDRDRFAALGRDWRALVADVPHLAGRLAGARVRHTRPMAIAGMPYGWITDDAASGPVYRLGDQAAAIPSFTGDGMAMALFSARHAAAAVLGGQPPAQYHRELAAAFRAPMRLAGMVAAIAAVPAAHRLLVSVGRLAPWFVGKVAAGTRVGRAA
jgi:menaquinone-9 beta-reductase